MPDSRFSDRAILMTAALAYLPLIFLGYGADGDSYAVVETARALLATGTYHVSRAPGFPTHEFASAALIWLGGSVAANLGSLAISLLGLWSLLRICAIADVPSRDLVVATVAFNPVYWINSASTMDYVWALGLALLALHAWMKGRPALAGLLFGLAIGARITTVVLPLAVSFAACFTGEAEQRRPGDAVRMLAVAAAVSVALFMAPFAAAGYSLVFFKPESGRVLSYYLPAWTWLARTARFAYKNLYIFGPLATAWMIVSVVMWRRQVRVPAPLRSLLSISACAIVGVEATFLIAPLEVAYLIPLLPFVAICLASLVPTRRVLGVVILCQLIYACVNVQLLIPDVAQDATTARVAPRLEMGVLVRDIQDRIPGRRH